LPSNLQHSQQLALEMVFLFAIRHLTFKVNGYVSELPYNSFQKNRASVNGRVGSAFLH
jgi:hypothetical protein